MSETFNLASETFTVRRVTDAEMDAALTALDKQIESAESAVLDLYAAGLLGYLRASDEWTGGHGEPLPDDRQDAARDLLESGKLPEFEEVVASEPVERDVTDRSPCQCSPECAHDAEEI